MTANEIKLNGNNEKKVGKVHVIGGTMIKNPDNPKQYASSKISLYTTNTNSSQPRRLTNIPSHKSIKPLHKSVSGLTSNSNMKKVDQF